MPPTKSIAPGKVSPLTPLGSGQGSGVSGRKQDALPIDRALPNSLDAEMSVLGSMLLSPQEAGSQARERLSEQHFYHAAHRVIFREITALQDALQAVDLITLTQRLQDKNQLDQIGGAAYLADLVSRVPTTSNLEHYLDIVWEKFLLRQLIEAAHGIITKSFEQQDNVPAWVD